MRSRNVNETLLDVASVLGKAPHVEKSLLQQLSAEDACPAATPTVSTDTVTAVRSFRRAPLTTLRKSCSLLATGRRERACEDADGGR